MKSILKTGGLTLLEVMISMAIISTLTSLVVPMYMSSLQKARASACLSERETVDKMIVLYLNDNPEASLTSLSELVRSGYLSTAPHCPFGGEYVLVPSGDADGSPEVACSIHYWPDEDEGPTPEPPLTSLGSTFEEITDAMIDLMDKFHDEKDRYPRSWSDYAFTDIGLDPAEWQDGYDGIVYKPAGKRIGIHPDDGYRFVVVDAEGRERELSDKLNWSLWYSLESRKWYYHSVNENNEIDISTLRVIKD